MTERNELEQAIEARKSAIADQASRRREEEAAQAEIENMAAEAQAQRDRQHRSEINSLLSNFVEVLEVNEVIPHATYHIMSEQTREVRRYVKAPRFFGIPQKGHEEVEIIRDVADSQLGWNLELKDATSTMESDGYTSIVGPGGYAVLQNGLFAVWGREFAYVSPWTGSIGARLQPKGPPYECSIIDPLSYPTIGGREPDQRVENWKEKIVDWGAELL